MDKVPDSSGCMTRHQAKKIKLDEKLNEHSQILQNSLLRMAFNGVPGGGVKVDQNLGKMLVKDEFAVKEESTGENMPYLTPSESNLELNGNVFSVNVDNDSYSVVVKDDVEIQNDEDSDGGCITGGVNFQPTSNPFIPDTLEKTKHDSGYWKMICKLEEVIYEKDEMIRNLSERLEKAHAEIEESKQLRPTAPINYNLADAVPQNNVYESEEKVQSLLSHVVEVYWKWLVKFQEGVIQDLNLKCRLVSKQWKMKIDSVLGGEHTPLKNVYTKVIIPNGDTEESQEDLAKVMAMMNAYTDTDLSVCPYPPRVLEIRDEKQNPDGNENSDSRKIIQSFLRKFGGLLDEFQYYGGRKMLEFTAANEWYDTLIEWISMMPNLKRLTIRNSLKYHGGIEDYIHQLGKPFPHLPLLECLTTDGVPESVVTFALYNNHVKSINCDACIINDCLRMEYSFPNLDSINCYSDCHMYQDFIRGPQLSGGGTLKTLELDNARPPSQDLYRTILFAQRFDGISLEYLHLKLAQHCYDLRYLFEGNDEQITSVIMPNLKKLAVTFADTPAEYKRVKCPMSPRTRWQMNICWTEKHIVRMCSSLGSLENLMLYNLDPKMLGWDHYHREMKRWQLKRFLRTGMVSDLFKMLSPLKSVEIQLAPGLNAGIELKSFFFLRNIEMSTVTGE